MFVIFVNYRHFKKCFLFWIVRSTCDIDTYYNPRGILITNICRLIKQVDRWTIMKYIYIDSVTCIQYMFFSCRKFKNKKQRLQKKLRKSNEMLFLVKFDRIYIKDNYRSKFSRFKFLIISFHCQRANFVHKGMNWCQYESQCIVQKFI